MQYTNYMDFERAKLRCEQCEIRAFYDVVVPSDGNKLNPDVLIVGEAPGNDEVEQLKPFVGKAGKLLRDTIGDYGFRKTNTLISNVMPCRPLNNKFPSPREATECFNEWLKEEIEMVKPECILLLGNQPLYYVLKLRGITKLRGEWKDYNGIPCMPTYHPSYIQRKMYMKDGPEIMENFRNDVKGVAVEVGFIT